MKIYSETTQRTYDDSEAVFYANLIQAAWLLNKPDATLLDIFCRSDGRMILVFPKELHKRYIAEWAERSQQYKEENNNK